MIYRDWLTTIDEASDVLAVVKDEKTAAEAIPKLKKLKAKMDTIKERATKIQVGWNKDDKAEALAVFEEFVPVSKTSFDRYGVEASRVKHIKDNLQADTPKLNEVLNLAGVSVAVGPGGMGGVGGGGIAVPPPIDPKMLKPANPPGGGMPQMPPGGRP
jgi:hypothetical protein